MSESQFQLLTTRDFLPLFVTQFLGTFNDNFFKNALVILITYKTAIGSEIQQQFLVTLAAGIFILSFLSSALAGELTDKCNKACLIQIIKAFEISFMVLAVIGLSSSLFIPRTIPAKANLKINLNIFSETLNIISSSREQKNVFLTILAISWFWLVGAAFLAQLPHLAKNILYAKHAHHVHTPLRAIK